MKRTTQGQSTHDNTVRSLAEKYREQGYTNIRADISGYSQPDVVNGHRPDVQATKNYTTIIAEVETEDSVSWQESVDQWKAFDRSSYGFHLCVPKTVEAQARAIVAKNGITVDYWWTY
jgi:hypothetical protein